jgi:hypothetical protein
VTEAESRAVLNTLTEHCFQDAYKNGRRAGNDAYARKGTTSSVMVASKLKVRLYGIYGGQGSSWAGFLRVLRFTLPSIPPTAPRSSSSIFIRGWYNRPAVTSAQNVLIYTQVLKNNSLTLNSWTLIMCRNDYGQWTGNGGGTILNMPFARRSTKPPVTRRNWGKPR